MEKWIAALLIGLPGISLAASNPDVSFFKEATQAGLAEVAAGRMAQAKGSSRAVRDFGAMMVEDHSTANAKLQKIAIAKGVELPQGPSLLQNALRKKAQMKSGHSFDEEYVRGQIKAHEDAIAVLQKEIDHGLDPEAKDFAGATLPKIKAHLEKITQIANSMGVQS